MHQHRTPSQPEPALYLLAGIWIAFCPTCGFPLSTARTQQRCERRAAHRRCPTAIRRRLMPSQRPNNPANGDQGCRDYPGGEGARPVVEPTTLAEQIADLRQLAIADPNTTLLELAIINVLDEFAEAVQNLAGNEPRGLGSV